ncbi:hypothetical protein [Desulfovibrio ferrophilus]|uniref:Phenylalanine--tRNA ligase alpha subunit n=1 Tax=Desulfovibrio ferrophilus TaxID=241368 RepID=A0A2Z6AVR2_9BACT|nr:hypothetical protein [Desulfovibrio ferrophilus]BBD07342.1 phenylalanine--tRNA ligase alpha subunit [Desulfovibrio ferrophilus]
MDNVKVQLENGDILEFSGELLSTASREVDHDARRSTVFEYRLFRRVDGEYLLVLDSYEKVRVRHFHLHFTALSDVQDYVSHDKGNEPLVRELFGAFHPGDDTEG